MVRRIVRFACDTCGKRYPSHDEAWGCELNHITEDAVAGLKEELTRIFQPQSGK